MTFSASGGAGTSVHASEKEAPAALLVKATGVLNAPKGCSYVLPGASLESELPGLGPPSLAGGLLWSNAGVFRALLHNQVIRIFFSEHQHKHNGTVENMSFIDFHCQRSR